MRDYVLVEELIHAFQFQHLGESDFTLLKLNCEIEAKVGWYMYRQYRSQTPLTESELTNAFGKGTTCDAMRDLAYSYQRGYAFDNVYYVEAYRMVVNGLTRSVYAEYPFSNELKNWKFSLLDNLMINCGLWLGK